MGMSVPEIVANAVTRDLPGDRRRRRGARRGLDRGHLQHLAQRAGAARRPRRRRCPGLGAKPIESVENACASGGQAVLSVIQKLQCGLGETGIAVGYEKMRDADGKMDGKLVGQGARLLLAPRRAARQGVRLPAPLRRGDGRLPEDPRLHARRTWPRSPSRSTRTRSTTRTRRCATWTSRVEKACAIEGINRYIAEGLRLKTFDCSQITDGYAGLILATEEGLARLGVQKKDCVRIAGWGQATDPLKKEGRDVLRPKGAYAAMNGAYAMAGVSPKDVNVAELHDCFTVMGGDRHRGDRQGGVRPGRPLLGGRQGRALAASAGSTPRAA